MLAKYAKGVALAAMLPLTAHAGFYDGFYFNPYAGAELGWRHLPWESAFGERHFRENFQNANFVLGAKIHKYFAIEGGYQTTNRQDKQEYYFGDALGISEVVLGYKDGNNDAVLHITQAELRGWHLNLLGRYSFEQSLSLFALVGVAWNRFYASTAPVYANTPATLVKHFRSDEKPVLRLGLGVDKMITSNFGTRLSFTWEETSRLSATVRAPDDVAEEGLFNASSKDSYVVGLGFYYQLCPNR